MTSKFTVAWLGGILILLAIYFFPFGQDIVMMYLTGVMGSQRDAWNMMYVITFAFFGIGFLLGGHKYLGINRLSGFFGMIRGNPIMFFGIIIGAYVVFNVVIGGWVF